MSDCVANVLAGDIQINIVIKRAAEVRKDFAVGWQANQINELYGKCSGEWNNATKGSWTYELIPELN